MRNKNIFIFGSVIAVLVWLFLSASEPTAPEKEQTAPQQSSPQLSSNVVDSQTNPSSVIEPIRVIEMDSTPIDSALSDKVRKAAQLQFRQATEYVLEQQWSKAEAIYLDLIKELPSVIEPYTNLAAVYAQTNRIDEARQVLLEGAQANQTYAVLYESLQSINGVLAAQAYRAALVTDAQSKLAASAQLPKLDLPMVNSIDLNPIDLNRQQELAAQLTALQTKQLAQQSSQSRIVELEQKLILANNKVITLDQNSSSEVSDLEAQLAESQSQLSSQTQALALAEQELVDLRQTSTIEVVAAQIEPTNTILPPQAVAVVAGLDKSQVDDISENTESTISVDDQDTINLAISLVEKWADSWSQQDVASYISHYIGDYKPPRAEMTHQEWMEQREVRLTNKRFIQVDVSDFDFEESGEDQFSVTFTQRYRSNTIDDTIRKRLVFVNNGDSLLSAKIVDELIVPD